MAISLVVDGEAIPLLFEEVLLEDDDPNTITGEEIKLRVARHYDLPEEAYDGYMVDRYPGDETGPTFVVRKKAIHGLRKAIFGGKRDRTPELDVEHMKATLIALHFMCMLMALDIEKLKERVAALEDESDG